MYHYFFWGELNERIEENATRNSNDGARGVIKNELARDDFSIIKPIDYPMYLGNPLVVRELIGNYVNQVYEWIKERGNGTMTKDDMVVKLKQLIDENADIIMGRNKMYSVVVGYHSKFGLGTHIKQVLGQFWLNHKEEYGNDPGKVLFAWLAASLVDSQSSLCPIQI